MTQVIEKARTKLAQLEAEAARIRDFIAVYEALAVNDSVDIGDSVEAEMISAKGKVTGKKTGDRAEKIVKMAKIVLRERQRPMTRSELVQALEARGLVIGGSDKNKNMGTVLWRSKEFTNIEGEGYWPKDVPTSNSSPDDLGL